MKILRTFIVLLMAFVTNTCGLWNYEPSVKVSYPGQRTVVSMELLEKIHQNPQILEITLMSTCGYYQTCEDQVELWSNKLRNLKAVNKWQLTQSGFRGPFGDSGSWQYRQKLSRQ